MSNIAEATQFYLDLAQRDPADHPEFPLAVAHLLNAGASEACAMKAAQAIAEENLETYEIAAKRGKYTV